MLFIKLWINTFENIMIVYIVFSVPSTYVLERFELCGCIYQFKIFYYKFSPRYLSLYIHELNGTFVKKKQKRKFLKILFDTLDLKNNSQLFNERQIFLT